MIEGYNCCAFKTDKREQIIFNDYDVTLLQRLIELKSMPQVTLKDACKLLLKEVLRELKNTVELQQKQLQNQNEQIAQLTNLLESQQKLLTHSNAIEKQQVTDRDKAVMTVMRELQEVKQMVAASNEKKWYQFWK
ncbi:MULTISPECIES: DUF3967 domain-containing protein [Bacillus]|uniref:DUF3967 domain-containing protein n=3 Tax=Bacillus cereus group TaxID=86661 RepID=A0ABD6TGB6_9BACI|nr:DUF3967 domain-containing protein [Bacillus wiedmannii]KAA0794435.1 DUF3967 domain-containing protein [Bacillus sp. BB081]KMP26030.1 hypothetical protein TU50_21540 [Bacillus wiedmannii]OAK08412.1 hypothetical protein A6278_26400 [Bacillus wiedmannii]OAK09008.1 hypothetical protein A6279_26095 [Bacillus wiedmannii]OAK25876.1 hypothetical protein A6283_25880 [Bacillus wiedmannii]